MADKNKIARGLSDEDLSAFLARCHKTPDLTLSKVQELAAEEGIQISIMSAKSFRDTTYQRYLDRLTRTQQMAKQVAELTDGEEGRTLADAASGLLGQQVFDFLVEADLELEGKDGMKAANQLALILKRLRSTDQAQKALELRVADFERQESERREQAEAKLRAAKDGGVSTEALEKMEEMLGLM